MNSDRIKEIQETTAYPESVSVQQALMKVWNECQSIPKEEPLKEGVDLVSNGTFQNDKDWNTHPIKVPSKKEIELIAGRHYYQFEEGFVAFILGYDLAIKRIKELNQEVKK